MSEYLLHVKNLKTYFHNKGETIKAVDGVDFFINHGETVALVGESGSGKSVTSLSIAGLNEDKNCKIVEGQILLKNQDLLSLKEKEMRKIRGNKLSMVFQDAMGSLNPVYTIKKQITEALLVHKKISKKDMYDEALRLLYLVGFQEPHRIMEQYPHELSGGMKQRLMIALAISTRPELLIADEPTTALDASTQKQILKLLNEFKKETKSSILLVTHDLGLVAEYADRVLVMYRGKIVEEADVFSIFENPVHPYTKGLLGSISKLDSSSERLKTIYDFINQDEKFQHYKFAPDFSKENFGIYNQPSFMLEVNKGHKVRVFGEESVVSE